MREEPAKDEGSTAQILLDELKRQREALEDLKRRQEKIMQEGLMPQAPLSMEDFRLVYNWLVKKHGLTRQELYEVDREFNEAWAKREAEIRRQHEEEVRRLEEARLKTVKAYWPRVKDYVAIHVAYGPSRNVSFKRDEAVVEWTCPGCKKKQTFNLVEAKADSGRFSLEEALDQGVAYDFKCQHPDHRVKNINPFEGCRVGLWLDKDAVARHMANPSQPITLATNPPEALKRLMLRPFVHGAIGVER